MHIQRILLISLALIGSQLAAPVQATTITNSYERVYLEAVRVYLREDQRQEQLGWGWVMLDLRSAFGQIGDFLELRKFCDENYDANEALCSEVGYDITVETPVGAARFNMFGETFRGDDFSWVYTYEPYRDPDSAIYITIANRAGNNLFYASDTEDFAYWYSINGNENTADPYCDNGICESLYWGGPRPWGVPEPGSLAMLGIGLVGLGLTRRKAR